VGDSQKSDESEELERMECERCGMKQELEDWLGGVDEPGMQEEEDEPNETENKGRNDLSDRKVTVDEDDGEDENEGRHAQGLRRPITVSATARKEHNKTHIPYRSWCKFCVRARSRNKAHKKGKIDKDDELKVPRISMDYFFMSMEDEVASENPCIIMVNEETDEKFARAVGQKGVGEHGEVDWVIRDISEELKSWGHHGGDNGKLIVKTDTESPIKAFRTKLFKYHGGRMIPEDPAKGESASNGKIEEAGKTVREFVKLMKLQIEEEAKCELNENDEIMQWIIRWAAMLVSRFVIGEDGKTGYERRRGRRCNIPVVRCGEKVLYRELKKGKHVPGKLEVRMHEGLWLGHARISNEVLIGTKEGVVRAYDVRLLPEDECWDVELIKGMRGTPARPNPAVEGSHIPIKVRVDADVEDKDAPEMPMNAKEGEIRKMRITEDILKKYGYSEDCKGCRHALTGMGSKRSHTAGCRSRLMKAMESDAEGRRILERDEMRLNERMAEEIERADNKDEEANVAEGELQTEEVAPEETMEDEKDLSAVVVEQVKAKIEEIESSMAMQLNAVQVDVAELYSPPRVTRTAGRMGLVPGEAMDLITGWDFTLARHREAAWNYVETHKPKLVIGSPECRMFSSLQHLNRKHWSEDREEQLVEAKRHIEFVVSMYKKQLEEGRYFLHEHPAGATSWDLDAIKKLQHETSVHLSIADQCQYGLKTWSSNKHKRDVAAKKKTKFMTNSAEIAQELSKRCNSDHSHQQLVDGRAKHAAEYPEGLCRAIVRGLIVQLAADASQVKYLCSVRAGDVIDGKEKGFTEHVDDDMTQAWDDVTGEILDPKEVIKARLKEVTYIRQKDVYKKITRREALRRGIKIVGTRWIDVNKGDAENPNHRSRLVAKEFNNGKEDGIFAATPPLEALRLLVSDAAIFKDTHMEKVLMVNDVARAFFEAAATREICVELPDEDKTEEDVKNDNVAILCQSLYGTRDAAANFQAEVRRFMRSIGFKEGRYNVTTYYHKDYDIKCMVHGDDFVSSCTREAAEWFRRNLERRFEIKTSVIGHGPGEQVEGKVLNRIIRATKDGFEYEADQRHGELIVKTLSLDAARPISTPGEDGKPWLEEEEAKLLDAAQATEYRALAARANYLSADRPDIQYATKEVCRGMASPTVGDRRKLKRLARYLKSKPRVVTKFGFRRREKKIFGCSDSDWAGCRRTARSTTGGIIRYCGHYIKSWSSTQKSITLSSGEAELVAAVKMCTEVLGVVQLLADWGVEVDGEVWVDSSAAIGTMTRRGNGKLRHVRVGTLWVQERIEDGDLVVKKVRGEDNPADLCTKHVNEKLAKKFMDHLNFEFLEGRAEKSLVL